jgi:hypothetical protein
MKDASSLRIILIEQKITTHFVEVTWNCDTGKPNDRLVNININFDSEV